MPYRNSDASGGLGTQNPAPSAQQKNRQVASWEPCTEYRIPPANSHNAIAHGNA